MKLMFLTAIASIMVCLCSAKEPASENIIPSAASFGKKNNTLLIENRGQVTDQNNTPRTDIQFKVEGAGGLSIFIGDGAIHYQFSRLAPGAKPPIFDKFAATVPAPMAFDMYRMDVTLLGADKHAQMVPEGRGVYCESHIGNSISATAHSYSKVTYKNVYPHIDWVLYTLGEKLKHEFVVHKGGNVADIKLQYGGATGLQVNPDGSLTAATPLGKITEQAPVSYQADGKPVGSAYVLNGNVLTYTTGSYEADLTIDPTLEWATYFGDIQTDATFCMVKDGNNDLVVGGVTYSTANIATVGAFQTTYSASADGVIIKYNTNGQLQWCTYFGTTQYDGIYGITVDQLNNIYITGGVGAAGLATAGTHQQTYAGGTYDVFIGKFTAAGARTWCTYLGGSGSDYAGAIAVDASGDIYISGTSSSTSGIATASVYQSTFGGGASTGDGILAKFNSSGARLWCTYYGGTADDQIVSISLSATGNIYLGGITSSANGIATSGSYQTSFGGLSDGFFVKFDNTGARQWATYLGGPNADRIFNIDVDAAENIFVAGSFASDGFATSGAYQTTRLGSTDAFVSKFTSGSSLSWFTYYGGTSPDVANGVVADDNNVYICGQVGGTPVITTSDAYQPASGGNNDAFIAKFNKTSGAIVYGSYYGGTSIDMGYSVIPDNSSLYFVGYTFSPGMATPGAAKETYTGGQQKGLVSKFSFCTPPAVSASGGTTICSGSSAPLTASGTATTYTWAPAAGLSATTGTSVTASPTVTTTYTVTGTAACSATALVTVSVNPTPTMNAVADVTKCKGIATGAINFASGTPGVTYSWTNTTTSIGLAASGIGSIPSFTVANSTTAVITATVIVTPALNGCDGVRDTFLIAAVPTPQNTTVLFNQTYCNGDVTNVVHPTPSVPGAVYNWTNSNAAIGIPASGSGDVPAVTATNSTASNISGFFSTAPTYTYNGVGCTGFSTAWTVTVKPFSGSVTSTPANDTICSGESTTLSAAATGFDTYTWLPATGLSATTGLLVTASPTTTTTYTFTASTISGCNRKATVLVSVNPLPAISPVGDITKCAGTVVTPTLSSTVPGTTYTWTNNNMTIGLANAGSGTGVGSFTATNTEDAPITGTVNVTAAADGCTGNSRTFRITVNPIPQSGILTPDQVYCANDAASTTMFGSNVIGAQYAWTNDLPAIGIGASGTGNIPPYNALNNTTDTVSTLFSMTPSFTNNSVTCQGSTVYWDVIVLPRPVMSAIPDQVVCNGSATDAVDLENAVSGTTYTWTNSASIGLTATGSGDIASFTAINTTPSAIRDTITVTPIAYGCLGAQKQFVITVPPIPTMDAVADKEVCNGVAIPAINFSATAPATTYDWTNSNGIIGLATTGTGDIASFTAVNTGSVIQTASVTVTPSVDGCVGAAEHFTIDVAPTPTATVPSGQVVCNGAATAPIAFTGSVAGTLYSWTNSNSSIGLASTGNSNIPSFTASNGSNLPVISTVVVTPSANGCTGASSDVTIRVNPTPFVAPVAGQARCNGAATADIDLTGTVSGTVYSWTNSNATIGLATTGTGSIASFTVINTGAVVEIATVTVTPAANGCTGTATDIVLTAYPTPSVTPLSDQDVCNGAAVTAIAYSGPVSGTTYSWTNTAPSIGLAATGSGSIASFTGTNNGTTPVTATVNVTPTANGCTGAQQSFTINVDPTPVVATPASQTVCNGATVPATNFTGPVSGTVYTWSNSATSIGLAGTGTGSIASFTGMNTGNSPVIATVSVTPSANGCTGAIKTFTIRVNPIPTMATVAGQVKCSNAQTSAVNFTGPVSSTTYNWTNSLPSIGLAATGSGNIAAFSAVNSTAVRVIATVNVTPVANSCTGAARSFTYTVDPNPVAAAIDTRPTSLCANVQYVNFGTSTPAATGIAYTWSADNATVNNVGSGGQYCLVSFPGTGSASVTLTTSYAATGCSTGQTYIVNAGGNAMSVPEVIYYDKHFVCLQNDVDSYVWGYDNAATLDSVIIFGEHNQSYYNAAPDLTGKYYWVMVTRNGCTQKAYFKTPATGIEEPLYAVTGMKIFPDPATSIVNIVLTGTTTADAMVRVFDMTGRQVSAGDMYDGKVTLNVEQLAPGSYVIGCYSNGARISSATFIKQ